MASCDLGNLIDIYVNVPAGHEGDAGNSGIAVRARESITGFSRVVFGKVTVGDINAVKVMMTSVTDQAGFRTTCGCHTIARWYSERD